MFDVSSFYVFMEVFMNKAMTLQTEGYTRSDSFIIMLETMRILIKSIHPLKHGRAREFLFGSVFNKDSNIVFGIACS